MRQAQACSAMLKQTAHAWQSAHRAQPQPSARSQLVYASISALLPPNSAILCTPPAVASQPAQQVLKPSHTPLLNSALQPAPTNTTATTTQLPQKVSAQLVALVVIMVTL